MKERPILFSGAMVRALLDGSKTQTRRIVKPQPVANHRGKFAFDSFTDDEAIESYWQNYPLWGPVRSPFGKAGDRLWVRETWSSDFANNYPHERVWYAADNDRRHEIHVSDGVRGIYSPESHEHVPFRWRPSIHMPRWASRITLEVTGVRVERLHDVTDAAALAEGVDRTNTSIPGYARERFTRLWTSINGNESWRDDPWVWVIEFNRVTP